MTKDHYRTLGVPATATIEDIKAAFRRLAFEHHPDRNGGNKAKEAVFKEISAAHDILSDPEARAKYDRLRAVQQAQQAQRTTTPPPRREAPRTPPPPQPTPRWTPPAPQPAPQPSTGGGAAAAGVGGGLFALGLGLLMWAAASQGGGYYDPTVDRHRGPDGRFRRS